MADNVNANIRVDLDTSAALASLQTLQSRISDFNRSVVQGNAQAVAAQRSMVSTLTAQISATKQFSTSMVNVETSVSRLGRAIDKNKLSLGEYFRYGVASSKTFGSTFRKEHNQVMDLARDRVKRLQTQYIAMGAAQNGVTKAMAVRPMHLFNADAAIGIQRQQLFNKFLNDGSTSLINFGKNTQWAGRQLMVGFTVPLTIFGGVAGKIFMDLERQVVNFRRVYGDAMTPAGETDQMVEEIQNLGKEFTKYGIAVKDTVGLAADVAAAGAQGDDLVAATAESTRLATLGMIDMNQAMTATIALQTAFKLSNEELSNAVNFLNAVENQTVLSLEDVSEAIPKVAPVIKGLGGDVQDLAIFLTAMREGGVSAAEGANALKSGLASLINPTKAAKKQLKEVGININGILSQNKGDIRAIVTEFGAALGTLDKFQRQQTLAKVFGKYQFARLGALFENISTEGSQAQRVVDLTGQSFEELGQLAEKELSAIEESIGMKFTGAVERLKLAIAPIGEVFLKIATPIIDIATKLLDKFNELSPGVKQFISIMVAGVGVVVPTVIMLIGLFGNFIGQAIKGFALFNNFFNRLRGGGKDLSYLAGEELDAAAAASSLEGKTTRLTSALNVQRSAVNQLARSYRNYTAAAGSAAAGLPQGFRTPPRRMATGGMVPGSGNKDTVPALLTPGESVINKDATQKFGPLLEAINSGSIGRFAEGRIDVGGRGFNVNVASRLQLTAIEDRLTRALGLGASEFEQMASIVDNLGDSLVKTIDQVDSVVRSIPELKQALPASAREGGKRHSYPGSDPMEVQMKQAGVSEQQISSEMKAANVSAKGAVEAVESNAKLLRDLGYTEKDLAVEANVARSHMVQVNKETDGLAAWTADKWQAQSQTENQLLETIRGSARNQEGIVDALRRENVSVEQSDQLIGKIRMGVGLTEDEFELLNVGLKRVVADAKVAATQGAAAVAALRGKETSQFSPQFHKQAIGAVGAREARVVGQTLYPVFMRGVGQGVLSGAGAASPPPWSLQLGRWIAEGIESGTKSGLADISKKVKMQMSQGGFGGRIGQTSPLTPIVPANAKMLPIVSSNLVKQTDLAGKEMSKFRGAASKMGKSLIGGSMKVQGAFFALDGLVFGLSMMDNGIGQMAQKIMPVVFGLQGLQMMLPMILSPLGLIVAAFSALAATIIIGRNKIQESLDEAAKRGKEAANSMKDISSIGEIFGKSLRKINVQNIGFQTQQKTKAQEFLSTEEGQSQIEALSEKRQKLGREGFVKDLAEEVATSAITQGLSGKQIDAYISAISEKLNDEKLYYNLRGELVELLDPKNKEDILKNGLLIKVRSEAATDFLKESMIIAPTTLDQLRTDIGEIYREATPEGIMQTAVSEVDSLMDKIDELQKEADNLMRTEDMTIGGWANERYTELTKIIIPELTTQLNFASREINYNNVELEDQAKAIENSSKWGAIFGEKLSLSNQYLAYQKSLLDDGTIKQKKYNERVEEANKIIDKNAVSMKRAANSLSSFDDGGEALASFMKQFGDQIFIGLDEELRTRIDDALSGIQDTSASIDLQIAYSQGSITVEDLIDLSSIVDSIPPSARMDLILAYGQGSLTSEELVYIKENADLLIGLDGSQIRFLISVSGLENVIRAMEIMRQINSLDPITDANFNQYTALQNELSKLPKDVLAPEVKPPGGGKGPPPPPEGGGEGSESWLQGLIKEIDSTLQILPKELNKLKKIVPDIPKEFIDLIGFGEEGLARITELLGLKGKDLKNLVNKWIKKTTSEINQDIQGVLAEQQQEQEAISILTSRGFSKEDAEEIASNSQYAFYVIQAEAGKTKKKIGPLLEDLKKLVQPDVKEEQIKGLREEIDLLKRSFDQATEELDNQIESQQDYIDSIQDEIDAIEELNSADNTRIRNLDRKIEMYNRDIDAVERLNEGDQERIDNLSREDELRNRVSQAISHDLEVLSEQESKVQSTYQKRIDALEEVFKINDRIVQQQKDQLDIAQAISSGDIYAATAAAQKAQQEQIKFAQEQQRQSLTTAMENEVSSLRTAGGLTREQAEKQISDIKEQSYQTSLQIRDLEDVIYQRNLSIENIKRSIRNIEDQKLVIEDAIYERETQILNIQTQLLDPAKKRYDALVDQRDALKDVLDTEIASIEAQIDSLELNDAQLDKINNLAKAWGNVKNEIAAANKVLTDGITKQGAIPQPIVGESKEDYRSRLAKWEGKRKELLDSYGTSISAAYSSGTSAMSTSMGIQYKASGGMIKGYKNGGVAGVDSVPAMLTPGEFVVRKAMVDKYGIPMFNKINQGSFDMPRYNAKASSGNGVAVKSETTANIVAPMYNNYNVNVSVSNANASADEIANKTIMKIKQMQNMEIRGGRGY